LKGQCPGTIDDVSIGVVEIDGSGCDSNIAIDAVICGDRAEEVRLRAGGIGYYSIRPIAGDIPVRTGVGNPD
jgi:hypothetical protein